MSEGSQPADGGTRPWAPDWCMAPAALLREWMTENGLTVPVLSVNGRTGVVTKDGAALLIQQVLSREPLTEAHARCLERCTQIQAQFWLSYEHNYRAGLTDATADGDDHDR